MMGWIGKLMGRMTSLEKELEVKNRHLTLLYDISRALSGTLDSEDLYGEMVEIVGCMLDFDELVLMLYNDRSRKLRVVATAVGRHSASTFNSQHSTFKSTGTVTVTDQLVRFTRPGVTEEYSVSVDGVRQDFVDRGAAGGEGRIAGRTRAEGRAG